MPDHKLDTRENRLRIYNTYCRGRPELSKAEERAFGDWIDGPVALVLRYEEVKGEFSPVFAMVSGGIAGNFLDLHSQVYIKHGSRPGNTPMEAIQASSHLMAAATWCLDVSCALEHAAIKNKIPVRNSNGANGLARALVWDRLMPTLPVPYPKD